MESHLRIKKAGFTLIELLVVIAIIGLLSSVVLASLNTARSKARDAKRARDLRTMQTAIELYRSDHDGDVPIVSPSNWKCSDCVAGSSYGDASFFTTNFITPKYISAWPTDPTPAASRASTDYGYLYRSTNGKDYILLIYGTVENASNIYTHGGWGNSGWTLCSNPGLGSTDGSIQAGWCQ